MLGCIRAVFTAGALCLCVSHALCQVGEPIQKTDPEYTEEARVAELEGTVVLRGTVGEDGFAHDLEVLQPIGLGLDEEAIEAVKQWHFQPAVTTGQIPVEFRLSTKQSRWHLIRVQFDTPPGVVQPVFTNVQYPIGAGLGPEAMEAGRLVVAMDRLATAKLTLEVNERGLPGHFQVTNASEAIWGDEATAVVGQWRFTPGMRNGIAVAVPCTVELVWGERDLGLWQAAAADVAPRVRVVVGTDGHVPQGRPALLNGVPVEVTTELALDPPR
jgi:TonB family protein